MILVLEKHSQRIRPYLVKQQDGHDLTWEEGRECGSFDLDFDPVHVCLQEEKNNDWDTVPQHGEIR